MKDLDLSIATAPLASAGIGVVEAGLVIGLIIETVVLLPVGLIATRCGPPT